MDVQSMESLTSIVSAALEARGVLAKIRAELRANVFAAIHEEEPPNASASPPVLAAVRADSTGQLTLQLVHELLSSCGLDYTASVFLPEASLDEAIMPSRDSLASALGLSRPAKGGEPLLVSLLRSRFGGRDAVARPGGDDAARPASAPATQSPLPTPGSFGSSSSLTGGPANSPALFTSRARPSGTPSGGPDAPHPPPFGGPRPAGVAAVEEERRLDALETKLAGLAGLPPTVPLAPSGTSAAGSAAGRAPGGGERPGQATTEPFADEIDEELLEDFADDDDFEDYEEVSIGLTQNRNWSHSE
jgi:FGFR1 oncogene partner